MAEIRLICPGCTAEYRVPDNAIPPEGREVECSACGKIWNATPRLDPSDFQAPAPAEQPADPPRLNRRLPDSVLDILRDEVEHERRARAAEDGDTAQPPLPAPRAAPDPEWPATTITRHFDPKPAEPVLEPAPEPPVSVHPAKPRPDPAPVLEARVREPAMQDIPVPQAKPAQRRGGYGAGFSLAAILVAGLVALYLMAPRLADGGIWSEELMQLRASLDQARTWLQDGAASLIR